MIRRVLETVFQISLSECPRAGYSWVLRFLFKVSFVVAWTSLIAAGIVRFSIGALPLIFLFNALFIMAGMLGFSFLVDRVPLRNLISYLFLGAGVSVLAAIFFYHHNVLFFLFSLMATGLFLPQVSILLSNHIEDTFTPNEALRITPAVESAETIGGIIAGILLALANFSYGNIQFLLFWMGAFFLFFFVFFFLRPPLPPYLHQMTERSEQDVRNSFNLNALKKSLNEVRAFPFLQVLSLVVFFQWIIFHFLEFQYTKAVHDSIMETASNDPEAVLTHGLGSLQILFHGSALLAQLILTGRVLKKFGAFGGFLFHSILTFLGAFSLLFGFGFFTAVLARNNFEVSTIVYKNSYENVYYAFRNGTQRALREFYEGLIYPAATILATSAILFIEFFFLEAHFVYVAQLALLFLVGMKVYFSFHLQKRYTDTALNGLSSPSSLVRYRAVEILSQKGHRNSLALLLDAFTKSSHDAAFQKKILEGFGRLGDIRAVDTLLSVLSGSSSRELQVAALLSLQSLAPGFSRTCDSREKKDAFQATLQSYFSSCSDRHLKMLVLRVLFAYDYSLAELYLSHEDSLIQAEAVLLMLRYPKYRKRMNRLLADALRNLTKENVELLSHLYSDVRYPGMRETFEKLTHCANDELRLLAYIGLLKRHTYRHIPDLFHLLFQGSDVLFSKAMELFETLHPVQKRVLVKSLKHDFFRQVLDSNGSPAVLGRLKNLLEICEGHDEQHFISLFSHP